ncbi:MAG: type II secretion system protein GspN [Bacteriovoracia bacterium]
MNEFSEQTNTDIKMDAPEYKPSKVRQAGIFLFGFFCFLFFLVMKLPEARIQNYITAHMRILAQEQGFLFSADKVRIGLLFGPSVKFYDISLKSVEDDKVQIKVPYVKISPRLLSLFSSTKKFDFSVELDQGDADGTAGASKDSMYFKVDLDRIALDKLSVLKKFIAIDLKGIISGNVKLDLSFEQPEKSSGVLDLKVNNIVLPAQNAFGFNLPNLQVRESTVDVNISKGKIYIRTLELGNDVKKDDVVVKVTGEGMMERNLDRSKINAKASLELSPKIFQSFPILESIMAGAKAADKKYYYKLSGSLLSPMVTPGG